VPLGPHTHQVRRAGALLQVAFLSLYLLAAPALHRRHCTGVCSMNRQSAVFGESGRGCCGTSGHKHSGKDDDGCQCLDDCCSIVGHCTAPTVVCDTAPPAPAPTPIPAVTPVETSRAPAARLLPYPTGPPSIA
jgi:hypothetical protein